MSLNNSLSNNHQPHSRDNNRQSEIKNLLDDKDISLGSIKQVIDSYKKRDVLSRTWYKLHYTLNKSNTNNIASGLESSQKNFIKEMELFIDYLKTKITRQSSKTPGPLVDLFNFFFKKDRMIFNDQIISNITINQEFLDQMAEGGKILKTRTFLSTLIQKTLASG